MIQERLEKVLRQGRMISNGKGVHIWTVPADKDGEIKVEIDRQVFLARSWEIRNDSLCLFSDEGKRLLLTTFPDIGEFEVVDEFIGRVFVVLEEGKATGERMFVLRREVEFGGSVYDVFFFSVFPDSYNSFLAKMNEDQLAKEYYIDGTITACDKDETIDQLAHFVRWTASDME